MKAQLILLDNPIIVTDEEMKLGDLVFQTNHKNSATIIKLESESQVIIANVKNGSFTKNKIISTNKPIDYNGIDFGIVDVEKEAVKQYKNVGYTKDDGSLELYVSGVKYGKQLNEKKFTLEEMRKGFAAAFAFDSDYDNILFDTFIKQLSLPKTFDIEIEETATNIKIIKKL